MVFVKEKKLEYWHVRTFRISKIKFLNVKSETSKLIEEICKPYFRTEGVRKSLYIHLFVRIVNCYQNKIFSELTAL